VVDVSHLLNPVSEEVPHGDDLEYDAEFLELERLAQGQPERQMGQSVIAAEPPDWRQVRERAGELIETERFVVRPGETQRKSLTLDDATRHLGVVVAYRALDRSIWRQVIEIPAHQASALRLQLDAYAISAAPLTPLE